MTNFTNQNSVKKAKIDACFSNSEISKSDLSYAFSNSNPTMNGLKFTKKGEDFIKLLNDKKSQLQTKYDAALVKSGVLKAKLVEAGVKFEKDSNDNDYPVYDYSATPEELRQAIYAYTDSLYPCNRLKEEIGICQLLVDNLDPKKSYDLSTPQLLSIQKAVEFDIEKSKDYGALLQKVYKRQGRNEDGSINPNAENDFLNDHILKSAENDIEKGGEGSKGGKVIGHTKSGKAIYQNSSSKHHKEFTKEDHHDAIDLKKKNFQSKDDKDKSTLDKFNESSDISGHIKERDKLAAKDKTGVKTKEQLSSMTELEVSKYANELREKRNKLKPGKEKEELQSHIDLADSFRSSLNKKDDVKKAFETIGLSSSEDDKKKI